MGGTIPRLGYLRKLTEDKPGARKYLFSRMEEVSGAWGRIMGPAISGRALSLRIMCDSLLEFLS